MPLSSSRARRHCRDFSIFGGVTGPEISAPAWPPAVIITYKINLGITGTSVSVNFRDESGRSEIPRATNITGSQGHRALKSETPSRACYPVVSRRAASKGANFRALKQYGDTTPRAPLSISPRLFFSRDEVSRLSRW